MKLKTHQTICICVFVNSMLKINTKIKQMETTGVEQKLTDGKEPKV